MCQPIAIERIGAVNFQLLQAEVRKAVCTMYDQPTGSERGRRARDSNVNVCNLHPDTKCSKNTEN